MTNAMKGALLSGLVFPGVGQIVQKHYKRGVLLILVVSTALLVVIVKAVRYALVILGTVESQGGAVDMSTISNAATRASTGSDSLTIRLLLAVIVLCWIAGIVDAYLFGRKKDIGERSAV